MPAKRILYFDGAELCARLSKRGRLQHEAAFRDEEESLAAFRRYVRSHRDSQFFLVADVADEGFQLEVLPHVRGADRAALLARRLEQHFHGTRYQAAIGLGRQEDGRKDERVLFTALTRPQALEPWLGILSAEKACIVGLFTPALTLPSLLRRLIRQREPCVVVCLGARRIRHTFTQGGELRFSRLTPLSAAMRSDPAPVCAKESERVYQYLEGQRMIPRGSLLPVLVLVHSAQRAGFEQHCRCTAELHYQLIDLESLAKRVGLRSPLSDSCAAPLLSHWVSRHKSMPQLAPAPLRRFHRYRQLRAAAAGIGATLLGASTVTAGALVREGIKLREGTQALELALAAETTRYAGLSEALPPLPLDREDLRALARRYESVEKDSPSPLDLFLPLGRALNRFPDVEIERIEWYASDESPAAHDGEPGTAAFARIHARLPAVVDLHRRGIFERLDAFKHSLNEQSLGVVLEHKPFDLDSARSLRGDTSGSGWTEAPQFVLRVSPRD